MLLHALFVLGLLTVVACGGRAESGIADQTGVGSGGGGGATSTSGGGPAGSGGTGAGSGAPSTAEAEPFYFDDMLPWFDGEGVGDFPPGMQDEVLHLSADGAPARATLSTHLPTGELESVKALLFSARASQPVRLLVSVGHTQRTFDYFSDTVPWPLATVDVGEQWQAFSIDVAEFTPPESAQDRALASFYIAFIIDDLGPRELWFDDVTFDR